MYEARVLLSHRGATENNLMSNIAGWSNQVIKSESIDGRNNREFESGSSSSPRTPHYNVEDGRGRTWADKCRPPNIVMGGGGGATQKLKSCLPVVFGDI